MNRRFPRSVYQKPNADTAAQYAEPATACVGSMSFRLRLAGTVLGVGRRFGAPNPQFIDTFASFSVQFASFLVQFVSFFRLVLASCFLCFPLYSVLRTMRPKGPQHASGHFIYTLSADRKARLNGGMAETIASDYGKTEGAPVSI